MNHCETAPVPNSQWRTLAFGSEVENALRQDRFADEVLFTTFTRIATMPRSPFADMHRT
jgi:hypothetical protein